MKLFKNACFFLFTFTSLLISQTTYIWTGAANSNFSTAGNWSPVRQIGLVTDILVFETGTSLSVINVNQVTIGQLIIRNNTQLTLSPSTGNAKCITVKGNSGTDMVIEQGSGLRILSNDPMLNFYIGVNATAEISGKLTFEGNIAHNINSADPMAIHFKNGSVFTQLSPGNIFNTIGASNCAVFESGSKFRINHPNASNPFGVPAPNSKVLFEESSDLILSGINSFQLNGRKVADLTIESGVNLNISEAFTSDVTINNLIVKGSASMTINNTNTSFIPVINIKGNIISEGQLHFAAAENKTYKIFINGLAVQSLSGAGQITFSENIESLVLYNGIRLERDAAIDCRVISKGGVIDLNGYTLSLNPAFPNPYSYGRENSTGQDSLGSRSETDNGTVENITPREYSISQNYPNPFNPSTKINFELPASSEVSLKVFDITGKLAATLVNTKLDAGMHTVTFNAGNLSSGVYFYTINAGSYTKTLKMILVK